MLLTAQEFARAWGSDQLIRLPSSLPTPPVPDEAREFLSDAGLPALIRVLSDSTASRITFCRLAQGVSPVLGEETVGPSLPLEWSAYWILGDDFFCNGSAWWCIDARTGSVNRIDIELPQPIEFVNSSVAHFASTLVAVSNWCEQCSQSPIEWNSRADQLNCELAVIDSRAMERNRSFWPALLDFIRHEGPQPNVLEKGTRLEGEQALQAGPW
jgi:SUKH-4 immunity protein